MEEVAVEEIGEGLIEPEKWLGKLGARESVFVHVCLFVRFPRGCSTPGCSRGERRW